VYCTGDIRKTIQGDSRYVAVADESTGVDDPVAMYLNDDLAKKHFTTSGCCVMVVKRASLRFSEKRQTYDLATDVNSRVYVNPDWVTPAKELKSWYIESTETHM